MAPLLRVVHMDPLVMANMGSLGLVPSILDHLVMDPQVGSMDPQVGSMDPLAGSMDPLVGNTDPLVGCMDPVVSLFLAQTAHPAKALQDPQGNLAP